MAPATVKYICNALEIADIIGNNKLGTVVEIGGGFGGFCKTLNCIM